MRIKPLLAAIALLSGAVACHAFEIDKARAVKSAYMADTGEGKRVAMLAGHTACGHSKDRNAERWKLISLRYRALNEAIDAAQPALIQQRAIELNQLVYASKMFVRCHNVMRGQAKDLAAGFDAALQYILSTEVGT